MEKVETLLIIENQIDRQKMALVKAIVRGNEELRYAKNALITAYQVKDNFFRMQQNKRAA